MPATARSVKVIPQTINPATRMPDMTIAKRRVAGYARVSTDSDEQYTSYQAQVDYYTQFIKSNPDWTFVDVYTDEGISGTNTKHRAGFNRMIRDALDGKIDLIVTKSISRFARNTVDTLTNVRTLKEHNVEVYFEKKDFDTANLLQKSKKEHNTPRYAAILGNIKGYFRCSYKCWCLVGV